MITNIKSLLLELDTVDEGSLENLETEECGIIVRTPGWVCQLRFPFSRLHLYIILE